MARFRSLPAEIEAFQLPAANDDDTAPFLAWAESVGFTNYTSERDGALAIETRDGVMTAQPGDWIIKGEPWGFYPCKPDVFAKRWGAQEGGLPAGFIALTGTSDGGVAYFNVEHISVIYPQVGQGSLLYLLGREEADVSCEESTGQVLQKIAESRPHQVLEKATT